ncbi:unnamed protein product [Paramecium octaurelia]|uniref:Uncharacterized protein n=2 Tax=Paramecium octaurelia TaxID=43137 RepID=A0A8S1YRV0_PAROT|nr:unnamed protein product [Paramecium octaurelia]
MDAIYVNSVVNRGVAYVLKMDVYNLISLNGNWMSYKTNVKLYVVTELQWKIMKNVMIQLIKRGSNLDIIVKSCAQFAKIVIVYIVKKDGLQIWISSVISSLEILKLLVKKNVMTIIPQCMTVLSFTILMLLIMLECIFEVVLIVSMDITIQGENALKSQRMDIKNGMNNSMISTRWLIVTTQYYKQLMISDSGDSYLSDYEECDDGNIILYYGCHLCVLQCNYYCQICQFGARFECSIVYSLNKSKNSFNSIFGVEILKHDEQCHNRDLGSNEVCLSCKLDCNELCTTCIDVQCYECTSFGWKLDLFNMNCYYWIFFINFGQLLLIQINSKYKLQQHTCGDLLVVQNEQYEDGIMMLMGALTAIFDVKTNSHYVNWVFVKNLMLKDGNLLMQHVYQYVEINQSQGQKNVMMAISFHMMVENNVLNVRMVFAKPLLLQGEFLINKTVALLYVDMGSLLTLLNSVKMEMIIQGTVVICANFNVQKRLN